MKMTFLILGITLTLAGIAQDSLPSPASFSLNGYLKDLQTLTFNKNFKELVAGNQLHNRINLKWKPVEAFTTAIELRNRLFWGEEVKLTPNFSSRLKNSSELVDMQKVWIETDALVLHTNVERLYADYRSDRFNFRIGRHRINWGVATTWNPNDIFNSYNFLDFDYEERPGSDGAKLLYIFNNAINVEMAYANTGETKGNIAAAKLLWYKWNYDFQLIGGWYKSYPTIGAGWAGNIKDAGFKGETQYFFGNADSSSHLNIALQGDYMFKNGWYLSTEFLFNSTGLDGPAGNAAIINFQLTPETLMPTKWNIILTTSKEFTPLFSATTSVLYTPGTNILVFFPFLQYNLGTNLDFNLVWQSYFAELDNNFEAASHRCFLRIKWSF